MFGAGPDLSDFSRLASLPAAVPGRQQTVSWCSRWSCCHRTSPLAAQQPSVCARQISAAPTRRLHRKDRFCRATVQSSGYLNQLLKLASKMGADAPQLLIHVYAWADVSFRDAVEGGVGDLPLGAGPSGGRALAQCKRHHAGQQRLVLARL